ncbi:MAG: efflux RND transporter periplasmic adaptor subunit [Gammaproteobacteria bacterium]
MKTSLIILMSTMLLATVAEAEAPLKTAQAGYREIPLEHRLDGVVEAVNQGTLTAQTQGQVMEILVDVDQYVKKGSLIIRLKDTEQKANLAKAKAELNAATARLEEVKKQQQRIAAVYEKKLVSSSALDQANANLKAATAQKKAAQAGFEQAEEQLRYTEIRAPFSGIVTQRHIEVGETAHPGQKLMSGLSLEKLRVNVNVPQSLVAVIRSDGKAKIQLPDGRMVEATDLTIYPYAQADSNSFKVRLQLPKGVTGLFPGMYVKTSFLVGSQKLLLIPQQAVVFRSEVTGVYVLNQKGKLSFRHIRLGQKVGDKEVAVLAGLAQGEKVALDPIAAGALLKQQVKEANGG